MDIDPDTFCRVHFIKDDIDGDDDQTVGSQDLLTRQRQSVGDRREFHKDATTASLSYLYTQ